MPRCCQRGHFWTRFDSRLDWSWCRRLDHLTYAAPSHLHSSPLLCGILSWGGWDTKSAEDWKGRKYFFHPPANPSRVNKQQRSGHMVFLKFESYLLYNSSFSCLLPLEVQRLTHRSVYLSAAKASCTPQQSSQIHFKSKLIIKDGWGFT